MRTSQRFPREKLQRKGNNDVDSMDSVKYGDTEWGRYNGLSFIVVHRRISGSS